MRKPQKKTSHCLILSFASKPLNMFPRAHHNQVLNNKFAKMLFDEKTGDTMHMALGNSCPESGDKKRVSNTLTHIQRHEKKTEKYSQTTRPSTKKADSSLATSAGSGFVATHHYRDGYQRARYDGRLQSKTFYGIPHDLLLHNITMVVTNKDSGGL